MRLNNSRQAGLALEVLRHLVRAQTRTPAAELATAVGTTNAFLSKVMVPLVRRGWVRSAAGPHGGYTATASLSGISVLEVIEAVDGPIDADGCLLPITDGSACPFQARWEAAKRALRTELQQLIVTEGLDPPARSAPFVSTAQRKGTAS